MKINDAQLIPTLKYFFDFSEKKNQLDKTSLENFPNVDMIFYFSSKKYVRIHILKKIRLYFYYWPAFWQFQPLCGVSWLALPS